jgi:hypothetical protein
MVEDGMGNLVSMVELHMTRQQFTALLSLVLDRQLDPTKEWVREWEDVSTGEIVTIDDLLSLLSIKI